MRNINIKANQQLVIPLLWTGKETELSYSIKLTGKGASVKFLGLLLGTGTQTLQLKLSVHHQAPETTSEVIIKSALMEKARVDIEGLVNIEKGAKGTNAWLGAHLLLLSEKAHGRAVPSLEILENDIKAGHAATVGRINDLEMFYLISRGLSERDAKRLIVQGFLSSMLDVFPDTVAKKANKELSNYIER